VQYNTVQFSAVQYSTVQCSTIQYSSVQYNTVVSMFVINWGSKTGMNTGTHSQCKTPICLQELTKFQQ